VPEGTVIPSKMTVKGNIYHTPFTMPTITVTIPTLKEDSWYANNGFQMITNNSQNVTLTSGGKYYFMVDYNFNDSISNLKDVVIVAKHNLSFNQQFGESGNRNTGIFFAPNGTLSFNQRCYFEGIMTSLNLVCNQQIDFKYSLFDGLILPFGDESIIITVVVDEE